jgi:hypothetical protein
MGQLDVFSLEDNLIISLMVGPVSTYMAEEIDASIESIVPYVYSSNLIAKKRVKLLKKYIAAGDIVGSMH